MNAAGIIETGSAHEPGYSPGACRHCGLPTAGPTSPFCCAGCETVFLALQHAGLDSGYYRLRDVARTDVATPARTTVDPLVESEVDSDWFLTNRASRAQDGGLIVDLTLDGVQCAACVWLIEQMPGQVEGVLGSRLDLARGRLTVHWDPYSLPLSSVIRWLARYGYRAIPANSEAAQPQSAYERRLLVKLGVSWALAANVMLIAFALYAGLDAAGGVMASAARWLSMALAVPAVVYGGSTFFVKAVQSIGIAGRARSLRPLHMDVPISLGILVGFGHSAYATVTGEAAVWFDSITVLIAALLTARWLQERSRRMASDAADRLLALVPAMARRISDSGAVQVVPTDQLGPGDVVQVPAEEVIPVDGDVIGGVSAVNNAVLTGESEPMPVQAGAKVNAGAMNLHSTITVETRAAGRSTRVGQLLSWMKEPDATRAPVVLLADRIGGYFVAAVVALAALTGLLWLRLDPANAAVHVAALLVITCPCALGMATPLALAVAAGRAARAGAYIKTEGALQTLTEVDTYVLDKTGTLTEGRPVLVERFGDEHAIALAAALERESSHALARALVAEVASEAAPVNNVRVCSGAGIRGIVGVHQVCVGKPSWVAEDCTLRHEGLLARAERFALRGLTPVAVAVDGSLRAMLGFGDRLRPAAPQFVADLQGRGAAVYLLTGDRVEVALDVSKRLSLPAESVYGNVSPEEKRDFVCNLQRAGKRVAMLGDGVNDAAALRAADVGIAVGGGASASFSAADVFLVEEGLGPVKYLLRGADRAMATVRRNLGLSLVYNVLGAGAAVAGLVSPLVAAVAMPISSLAVVGSSIAQGMFKKTLR